MPILDTIFGGGVGDLISKVVGSFKLSPAAQQEFNKALEDHRFELAKLDKEYDEKLLEAQSKEVETASANIRAEAANGDTYTSRARPTFLYLMYVILGWNYIVLPMVQYATKNPLAPIALPDSLMWLFGSGFLGYTGARSWDKFIKAKE